MKPRIYLAWAIRDDGRLFHIHNANFDGKIQALFSTAKEKSGPGYSGPRKAKKVKTVSARQSILDSI